jgi:hypothetical protein
MRSLSIRLVVLTVLLLSGLGARASAQASGCPVSPAASDALLAFTASPYSSVEDTYLRMQCLEQALRLRDDPRAVFASIYVDTTAEVKRFLDDGAFLDEPWSRRYTAIFADQYRRAFYDWERGARHRVAGPWRIAFQAAARGEALIAQHLLLGVNAHVNYDLANTLAEVGLDGDREQKRLDHFLLNDILGGIVDRQMSLLQTLYAPGLAQLPQPIEDLTEDLFYVGLSTGRGHAWNRAVAIYDANNPFTRFWIRSLNATEAEGLAAVILSPGLSPGLMQLLHRLEQGQ